MPKRKFIKRPPKRCKWKVKYYIEKKDRDGYYLEPHEKVVEAWTRIGAKKEVLFTTRAKLKNISVVGKTRKRLS